MKLIITDIEPSNAQAFPIGIDGDYQIIQPHIPSSPVLAVLAAGSKRRGAASFMTVTRTRESNWANAPS